MPVIFSERVYRAVARNRRDILRRLEPAHFESYKDLNEALGWLSPKERCDAIYGDWLESINSQAGATLLRTRKLLIEQGGLAANYLAEFAQNADDAYPHDSGGEVHISAPPGWLQVWNNGRSINGTDLLGLCRFFSNGSKIDTTDAELIGKFGIGFKSCYRIGTEVWVQTWDKEKDFCFRIPLSNSERPQSHFDSAAFSRVRETLGQIISTQPRTGQDELGYCTPEFAAQLPDELRARVDEAKSQSPDHGTFFAVHLHLEGERVLRSRLRDQSEQVFELCPLFVRRLRVTRLEDTTLRLIAHRQDESADIPGVVTAERVTLEAQLGDSPSSNARFWRLTGPKPRSGPGVQKQWRVALHADSQFRLNLSREAGETTSLRDGAAYAFFPLAINWPFNVHLHLDLPTNLDRSSWNPEKPDTTSSALAEAAAGLGQWLEEHQTLWHRDWSISSLIKSVPIQPGKGQAPAPDFIFYSRLKAEVQSRRLLRSVWGERIAAQDARSVRLRDIKGADEAWQRMGAKLVGAHERFPWCASDEGDKWSVPELTAEAIVAAARDWTCDDGDLEGFGQQMLKLVLSAETLGAKEWKAIFPLIPVQQKLTLAELLRKRGGATLSVTWHELFSRLAKELDDESWAMVVFEGRSLVDHFLRFASPLWNPDWEAIPAIFHPELPSARVDQLWISDKEPCPAELREAVMDKLVGRDASGALRPIRSLWLWSRSLPEAFKGLFVAASASHQRDYRERLAQWELIECYRQGMETQIDQRLRAIVADSLKEALQKNNLADWLGSYQQRHQELRNPDLLQWQPIYEEAVRDALSEELATALKPFAGMTLVSRSLDSNLRSVLAWLSDFSDGLSWLEDVVLGKLRAARLGDLLQDVPILRQSDIASRRAELVRALVGIAHVWQSKSPTPAQLQAIDRLAAGLTKTDRKGMAIGISPRVKKPLDEFLSQTGAEDDPNSHWLHAVSGYSEKLIPPLVSEIHSLREVCPSIKELTLKCEGLPDAPIGFPVSAMAASIANLHPVARLLREQKISEVCEHRTLTLQWWDGERLVAETSKAKFYFQRESRRLYVTELAVSLDDHQLKSVLHTYLSAASQDPEVKNAFFEAEQQRQPLIEVYSRYRERIRATLLDALVTKMGYNTSHIWRELLQNAENAYASMADPRPAVCSFEIEATEEPDKKWRIGVTNHGRRFNQADRDQNDRRDIDRIISLGGERHQVKEELGRYNLGFKSLFATTDVVAIRSGGYDFQVRDLLLLYPAAPAEDASLSARPTSFTWTCSRADLERILGVTGHNQTGAVFPFLTPPFVLFGRYVSQVVLKLKGSEARLAVERTPLDGAETVLIHSSVGGPDRYLVLRGECMLAKPLSFAAAVRLNDQEIAVPVKEDEQYFHLTYPTRERSYVPFIIHGDFELAGLNRDQLEKQSKRNLSLILSAIRLALEYALSDLDRRSSPKRWLGWAQVLAPADLLKGVGANYEEGRSEATRLADEIKARLLAIVPHEGSPCPIATLVVPSPVMRKFAAKHGRAFGIDTRLWLEESLAKGVESLDQEPNLKLNDWVSHEFQDEGRLALIHEALEDFRDYAPQERFEVVNAREAAGRRLQRAPRRASGWTIERIAEWWTKEGSADPYILEGSLFTWFDLNEGKNLGNIGPRRIRLVKHLSDPKSDQGKETWYRLFTFACLLSAGHRVDDAERFRQELNRLRFFANTAKADVDFAAATAETFDLLVHRAHANENAAGENAHYWRHIFYDARKVHHLIYRNSFAEVFLDLCRDEDIGEMLPHFLRSGQLPGQRPWQGVVGQSAAAPLLFIIRELRRLGLIHHTRADPFAFFACKPVRKVASALNWIEESYEDYASFDELLNVSKVIHKKYLESDAARSVLLPHFDIPLLDLERSGNLYRL